MVQTILAEYLESGLQSSPRLEKIQSGELSRSTGSEADEAATLPHLGVSPAVEADLVAVVGPASKPTGKRVSALHGGAPPRARYHQNGGTDPQRLYPIDPPRRALRRDGGHVVDRDDQDTHALTARIRYTTES